MQEYSYSKKPNRHTHKHSTKTHLDTSSIITMSSLLCFRYSYFKRVRTFIVLAAIFLIISEFPATLEAASFPTGKHGTVVKGAKLGYHHNPQAPSLCEGLCVCDKAMKHINCTQSGISKLTDFDIPKSVKSLLFDKNKISVIPAGVVQKLPNLVFLGISINNISRIENQSICSGNQLKHLILDYNKIAEIPHGLFENCSQLVTLQLKVNYLIIEEVAKLLPFLPSLQTLDLSNNQFQNASILPVEFSTLKNLQYLYLDAIEIHSLADDFFHGLNTSKLIELSLLRNVIMKVSNKSFSNMESLELLDLSLTEISVQHARVIFHGLKHSKHLRHLNLKYVFMDGDKEDEFGTHFFKDIYNTSLRVLHMEGNYGGFLGTLSKGFFSHLHHLQQLYLDHNELKTIHPKAFHRLHKLKKLSLCRNYLSCLVDCQFLHSSALFPSLEDLDLSNNVIDDSAGYVSFSSDYFPKLRNLNLRKNRLSFIREETFQSLKSLRSLDLSENPISAVQEGSFEGCVRLKSLIMEECYHITTLPRHLFRGLTHLQLLKLNGNGIRSLQSDALFGLTSLLHLELRNNQLSGSSNTLYNMSMPSSNLTVLDLSYNNIEYLPGNILQNASLLSVLNMSHNRVVRLWQEHTHLTSIKHLKVLDLSYNDILTIPDHTFDGLENLSELNLEGNPFYCDCELKATQQWLNQNHKVLSNLANTKCAGPSKLVGTQLLAYHGDWVCRDTLQLEIILGLSGILFCMVCIPVLWLLYRKHRQFVNRSPKNITAKNKRRATNRKCNGTNETAPEEDNRDTQVPINSIETVNMISHCTNSSEQHANGDCGATEETQDNTTCQTNSSSGCFSLMDIFKKRKSHLGGSKKNGMSSSSSGHEPLIDNIQESQSTI